MEKKKLGDVLSGMLLPIGFKKKGNYWVINGNEITKMVNLQNSQYSNSFYINYGYIIKALPLGNQMMHVYNRVSSLDVNERNLIKALLDFDSDISDEKRETELKQILNSNLISKMQLINTEKDLLNELKQRSQLNDIPSTVLEYLNLERP